MWECTRIPFVIPILWPVYDVMDKQRGRARSKTKEAERVVRRTAGRITIRFEAVFRVDNNPLPFRTDVRMAQLGGSTTIEGSRIRFHGHISHCKYKMRPEPGHRVDPSTKYETCPWARKIPWGNTQ